MSEQEFTVHVDELIPAPSVETNGNLLDLANSLWFEMKEDLYHRAYSVTPSERELSAKVRKLSKSSLCNLAEM